jgi:transcriptional regulator with XRE-family HTH domain
MDDLRFGLSIRALRRRRGWTQAHLAEEADLSQTTISRIERGHAEELSVAALRGVLAVLDARLPLRALWRGGELDRLLDERHSWVVGAQVEELEPFGWLLATEVTFNHYGDRGSIDLLGWHPVARVGLVDEAKSEITSAEETLRRLDVKQLLGAQLVAARWGETPRIIVPMLSVLDNSANRKRVARLAPLFGRAFPLRGRAAARWLADPAVGDPRGVLRFLEDTHQVTRIRTPHRVRPRIGDGHAPDD